MTETVLTLNPETYWASDGTHSTTMHNNSQQQSIGSQKEIVCAIVTQGKGNQLKGRAQENAFTIKVFTYF